MKQKLFGLLLALTLLAPIAFGAMTVSAAGECPAGYVLEEDTVAGGGKKTCVYSEDCDPKTEEKATDAPNRGNLFVCCPIGHADNAVDCFTAKYINPLIALLAGIFGVVAVFGIASGGIQYAASGGDPQKVAAGKGKITKSLYGVVGFLFLFSALQFLSPGGFSQKNSVPPGASNKAEACSSVFFGLKPWFAYLPDDKFDSNCQIDDFIVLPEEGKPSDVGRVLLAIVDNLVRIAAFVAVVFVVIGGVKYVTSQGEPEGTKSAKDSIINAMIGLVIAIVAASVVAFIGNQLT